ncbi:MAG: carboxypeptidase-like regulatory domain-containing protein, partial [Nitriliruptoraceae bacterium]
LVGSQPTTTIISCGTLAFVEQPGDTSVHVAIPGKDGTGSPEVAIVDGDGEVITGASASITVARTDNGSLGGTLTQDTQDGIATFDGLSIAEFGTYTVTASADGYLDVDSDSFEVFASGDTCTEGEQCTTTLNDDKDGSTSLSGTAFGGTGALIGNSEANGGEVCGAVDADGNPVEYDVDDYSYLPNQVTIGGTNLTEKLVEFSVSKQYDQQQANNGVAFYQVCAEPLAPFTEFSTFVDIFGNVVVNSADSANLEKLGLDANDVGDTFQTSGFLPDCSGADDTPCVESRVKRNGGPLLTVRWGSRWAMR